MRSNRKSNHRWSEKPEKRLWHGLVVAGVLGNANLALLACVLTVLSAGCHAIDYYDSRLEIPASPQMAPPTELDKVSLPEYRLEPPDMIRIETLKLVPRPPYKIEAQDTLMIRCFGTPYNNPIDNYYTVSELGIVDLGPAYGVHYVMGQTVEEAARTIQRNLQYVLQQPTVTVQLAQAAAAAQINGDFLVQQDGTVNLRGFGAVYLSGLTVYEARQALLKRLGEYFELLDLSVDVIGFHSEGYYVIIATAGSGERIVRLPVTGNETVLDAVAQIQGLNRVSSKTMWVARATPGLCHDDEALPVDWNAIVRGGATDTNYQLMPGDRLYIVDDKLIAANEFISKFTTPISRLLSITSLGASTLRGIQVLGRNYNKDRRY